MEIIDSIPACFEKRPNEIGPPKRGKCIEEGFVRTSRDVRLRDEHWNALRQSVITPHLENVANKIGLIIKIAPLKQARFEGIMLEGNEREVPDAAMGGQVVEEAAHPGSFSLRIGPDFNVLGYALENRAAQFEFGIKLV